jgi:2-oxoisovalerate dehydrogenase E1 component
MDDRGEDRAVVSAPPISPSTGDLLALYRRMLLIRQMEEQLARAHQSGAIPGACHTYVGEEAIATGVCGHLRPDYMIFSTHRRHRHALAKALSHVYSD